MEDYQKRMVLEYKELDGRVRKLENFIFSPQFDELDKLDKILQTQQLAGMKVYRTALGDRLHYIEGIDLKSI